MLRCSQKTQIGLFVKGLNFNGLSDLGGGMKEVVVRWCAVLTAIAYFAGSRIGFSLTPHNTPIALFWPPNAIFLAILLLNPIRVWWVYWLAVLPAHLLVQTQMGIGITASLGWYVSNTSEALIGAALVRLVRKGRNSFGFNDTQELNAFLLCAVLAAPFLTSFLDAATAVRTGYSNGYWVLWWTRLVSNMIANLTLVPAIVTICREGPWWLRKITFARCLELACLLAGVLLVSLYVFFVPEGSLTSFSAVMFAPLPFLLWAALRFGAAGLSSCLLAVALISLGNAVHGLQSSSAALVAKNVLTLQVLVGVSGVPLLWLSVLIHERRGIEITLDNRRELLVQAEQALRTVGRRLHGDLTQQLILLGLQVDHLSSKIEPLISLRTELRNLNQRINQLSSATRDWSNVLDPVNIEYLGLSKALAALCRRANENSTVRFSFSSEIEDERLDSISSLCLYRIVQETVENIVKLKSARVAKVRLEASEGSARLVVEHDGAETGNDVWREGETGVFSMGQRIALLNGNLAVHSSGSEIKVEVAVPFNEMK